MTPGAALYPSAQRRNAPALAHQLPGARVARLPGALILAARLRLAWVHLAVLPFRWVGAEKSKETRETVAFYLEHSCAAGGRPAARPLLLYLDTFSRLRPATAAGQTASGVRWRASRTFGLHKEDQCVQRNNRSYSNSLAGRVSKFRHARSCRITVLHIKAESFTKL